MTRGVTARPPIGVMFMTVSVLFLLAGLGWPQAADALLRLYIVALAGAYVTARAYAAAVPVRTAQDLYSPFHGDAPVRAPAAPPASLRALAADLDGADSARVAQRVAIPSTARAIVTAEATRRLAEHHSLQLDNASDHDAIRALVSEATWHLIRPDAPAAHGAAVAGAAQRTVPLSQLDAILDDLERL